MVYVVAIHSGDAFTSSMRVTPYTHMYSKKKKFELVEVCHRQLNGSTDGQSSVANVYILIKTYKT